MVRANVPPPACPPVLKLKPAVSTLTAFSNLITPFVSNHTYQSFPALSWSTNPDGFPPVYSVSVPGWRALLGRESRVKPGRVRRDFEAGITSSPPLPYPRALPGFHPPWPPPRTKPPWPRALACCRSLAEPRDSWTAVEPPQESNRPLARTLGTWPSSSLGVRRSSSPSCNSGTKLRIPS